MSHSNFTFLRSQIHNVEHFYTILQNRKKTWNHAHTLSRSLIIWEPAIKTRAQEVNGSPGTNWGGPESWRVPAPWKLYFNCCAVLFIGGRHMVVYGPIKDEEPTRKQRQNGRWSHGPWWSGLWRRQPQLASRTPRLHAPTSALGSDRQTNVAKSSSVN